jgi:hypothetical protein
MLNRIKKEKKMFFIKIYIYGLQGCKYMKFLFKKRKNAIFALWNFIQIKKSLKHKNKTRGR